MSDSVPTSVTTTGTVAPPAPTVVAAATANLTAVTATATQAVSDAKAVLQTTVQQMAADIAAASKELGQSGVLAAVQAELGKLESVVGVAGSAVVTDTVAAAKAVAADASTGWSKLVAIVKSAPFMAGLGALAASAVAWGPMLLKAL